MSAAPRPQPIAPVFGEEAKPRHGFRAVVQSIGSKSYDSGAAGRNGYFDSEDAGTGGPWRTGRHDSVAVVCCERNDAGVPSSLIYHLRNRTGERERLVANGFVMAAVMGAVAGIAAAAILPWWLRQYSPGGDSRGTVFLIGASLFGYTRRSGSS